MAGMLIVAPLPASRVAPAGQLLKGGVVAVDHAGSPPSIVGTEDKWTWILLMGPDVEINLTPAQAREVAAHLTACADRIEGGDPA